MPFESEEAKQVRRRRDLRIYELSIQGLTDQQIADVLRNEGYGEIKRNTVSVATKRISLAKSETLSERAKIAKIRHADTLKYAAEEALRAWEKSKGHRKLTRNTRGSGTNSQGGYSKDDRVVERESSNGDPRFLRVAIEAMKHEREVLGIDKPGEATETRGGGGSLYVFYAPEGYDPTQAGARAIEPAAEPHELPPPAPFHDAPLAMLGSTSDIEILVDAVEEEPPGA